MVKQYVLFIVINNIKKYKKIKKKLIEINCNRFTVLDTIGSTKMDMCHDVEYASLLWNSLGDDDGKNYNKTVLLVVESEEEVLKIMDEIEAILYSESKKPGKGIMFTIPVYKSQGVRFSE